MKKEFQREIGSSFSYSFEIEQESLYAISIKASCKPGWRNKWWLWFKGKLEDILDLHLDDEDLRVEIDDIVFRKPKGKRGLFNSPAAFSGTKTLGRIKTVVFIIHLNKGSHTIKFIPDGSPYLESIEIEELDNPQKYILYLNTQAEDENYYSWYTFALVNLPLKSVSITAQAGVKEGASDDDDLKIFINGEPQENPSNCHKKSYFCGFTLKGRETTFSRILNLLKSTHYIELFADKTPAPRPLDPNLVKAIIYVESRMGYGSSLTGYPAYPDIMQVGNPEDPALHVLNNDSEFPTEYEAWSGKVEPVNYKGKAKVTTPYESIYWGARWLYHKAQDVGAGERQVWYSWRRAVHRYGPGKESYTKAVWNLYKFGKSPNNGENLF